MLILFLVTLFVPLLLGVPVAFSLVISAIVLMASQDLISSQLIVQQFVGGINSFSLLAVPFFMLAGELMNNGGITRRIVDVVSIWVGRFCGGNAGTGRAVLLVSSFHLESLPTSFPPALVLSCLVS